MCKCKQNDLAHLGQKLEYCLQFSGRTVETASMKLVEEVGEVIEAVFSTSLLNKEKRYKQIPDSAVVEECVYVILCAISVIRLKNPAFSMQNVLKLLERKLDKWIIKQGWIMPKGFSPSEPNLNIYNNDQPDPSSDTVSRACPHPMYKGVYLGGNLFTDEYGRLQQMIPPKNDNVQPSPSFNSATQVPLANGNLYAGTNMSLRATPNGWHLAEQCVRAQTEQVMSDKVPADEKYAATDSVNGEKVALCDMLGEHSLLIPLRDTNGVVIGHVNTRTGYGSLICNNTEANTFREFLTGGQPTSLSIRSMQTSVISTTDAILQSDDFEKLKDDIRRLNDDLLSTVLYFPELENTDCIKTYTLEAYSTTDSGIRYDAYVSRIFNMLEYLFQRVRKLHTVGPMHSEIQKIMRACLGYTEYFDAHRQWWEHNQATIKVHASYDEDFVSFIAAHYATFDKGTKHNL